MWYVYEPLLNAELDEWIQVWNNHRIRKQKYGTCPSGFPEVLYSHPYLAGTQDCGIAWADATAFQAIKASGTSGMVTDPVHPLLRAAADDVVRIHARSAVTKDNALRVIKLLLRLAGDSYDESD